MSGLNNDLDEISELWDRLNAIYYDATPRTKRSNEELDQIMTQLTREIGYLVFMLPKIEINYSNVVKVQEDLTELYQRLTPLKESLVRLISLLEPEKIGK